MNTNDPNDIIEDEESNLKKEDIKTFNGKKCKEIFITISNILICILSVLLEESFIAFFPVMVILVMCYITSGDYDLIPIFNNIFVGFSTISAGNIIYLSSKRKTQKNKEFLNTFTIITFFSFSISLICCCGYANVDMGYVKITPDVNKTGIMIVLLILILPGEILKIKDKISANKEEIKH